MKIKRVRETEKKEATKKRKGKISLPGVVDRKSCGFAEPRLARAAKRRKEGMLRVKGTGQVLQARHYVYHTKRPRNASPQNRMSRAEN